MRNSPKGEASRLIASGGIEVAATLKLSIVVIFAACRRSGEVRHA
jgi:hypothetical protein